MAEQTPSTPQQPIGKQPSTAAPQPPTPPTINGAPVTASQLPPTTAGTANAGHYNKDGKLTREGMEHAIRSGGSVMHEGRVYSTIASLPSEADLAKGDTDAEAAALENINRQRAQLDAQEASLRANQAAAGKQPAAKK